MKIAQRGDFGPDNKIAEYRPLRPLGRYPGSKNRMASYIVEHIPAYHDLYNEPFLGMGAVLFTKARSNMEVVNDLNGDVVHLFRMMREHPEEMHRLISLTAWAPDELALALEPTADPIERARRFFCQLWMSWMPFDNKLHFRRQFIYSRGSGSSGAMVPAAKLFADTEYLYAIADRLRGVIIENVDALLSISNYDSARTIHYVDPPYVHSTRKNKSVYEYEMDIRQHRELADVLNGIEGMAILSGYSCSLYEELYEDNGWVRVDKLARTNGNSKVESIWLNRMTVYRLEEEEASRSNQLRMF